MKIRDFRKKVKAARVPSNRMFAAERMRILWLIAGALSVAIDLAATAVDPMPLDGLKRL